ncbi:hypothetical protein [Streptomyces werraensis]|uniref:hypothetical protein n=1 Tax=Streptomyces werraensis TaxID=68284 RepID=UPI00381F0322
MKRFIVLNEGVVRVRKFHRRLGQSLVATIAALTATVAISTSASAGTNGPTVYDASGYKAYGIFLSYGDHIRVDDVYADGKSAVVVWNDPHLIERHCWDSNGSNNGYTDCNYNIREGDYVDYRVCLGDYGSGYIYPSTCGRSVYGYA